MCKRVIVEELEIGGLSHKVLMGIKNMYPEVAKRFIRRAKENPPIEKVRLVGIRCCQYNLGEYVSQDRLYKSAINDGLEPCPLHLPFHYFKEHGEKDETFIFATRAEVIKEFVATGGDLVRHYGYLAVRGPNIFDYAQRTSYGSGVEFAFMQRL